MELKEYSIIRRVRDVPGILTQTSKVPDFDRVFYIVKIGRNRFVEVLCVTDYVHQEQTAYMMRNCIFGITKEGDRFFYHDILSLEQEKILTNMVIETYNKEFQYKPLS